MGRQHRAPTDLAVDGRAHRALLPVYEAVTGLAASGFGRLRLFFGLIGSTCNFARASQLVTMRTSCPPLRSTRDSIRTSSPEKLPVAVNRQAVVPVQRINPGVWQGTCTHVVIGYGRRMLGNGRVQSTQDVCHSERVAVRLKVPGCRSIEMDGRAYGFGSHLAAPHSERKRITLTDRASHDTHFRYVRLEVNGVRSVAQECIHLEVLVLMERGPPFYEKDRVAWPQ